MTLRRLGAVLVAAISVLAIGWPAGTAEAAALPLNGTWVLFEFEDEGAFSSPSEFTFQVRPGAMAVITLTDVECPGERFAVYDKGVLVGLTSPPNFEVCGQDGVVAISPLVTSFTEDPNTALADPDFSHGTFTFGPGSHSLQIEAVEAPRCSPPGQQPLGQRLRSCAGGYIKGELVLQRGGGFPAAVAAAAADQARENRESVNAATAAPAQQVSPPSTGQGRIVPPSTGDGGLADQRDTTRVRVAVLLASAGALAGMSVLRHATRKN